MPTITPSTTSSTDVSFTKNVQKVASVLFAIVIFAVATYIAYWLAFVAPVKTHHLVLEQTSSQGWAWFAGFIVVIIVATIGLGGALAETEE